MPECRNFGACYRCPNGQHLFGALQYGVPQSEGVALAYKSPKLKDDVFSIVKPV